jgi:filamentous hemagglutinin family protein
MQAKNFQIGLRKLTTCFTLSLNIFYATSAYANPQGPTIVSGDLAIENVGSVLNIKQNSDKAIINWQSFNIQNNEVTTFKQNSPSSIILNRVNSADPSSISGKIAANGTVILINQNGVLFNKGSVVNVNSLIASTANISDDNFLNNQFTFTAAGNGLISNEGLIIAQENGLVGLVGPNISNNGVIQAKLGKVALASGDSATIDLYGDNLLELQVNGPISSQLIEHNGSIAASEILITAAAGQDIVNSLISITGELKTVSVAEQNGVITISAQQPDAQINIDSASIDASGELGGNIAILADNISLLNQTVINASGNNSQNTTGQILIGGDYLGQGETPTAQNLYVDQGVQIYNDAIESGNGGKTILWSNQQTTFKGSVFARGGQSSGNGGFLETSSAGKLIAEGSVDLTAANGAKGTYLLDPDNIYIYGLSNGLNGLFLLSSFQDNPDLDGLTNNNLSLWLDPSDIYTITLNYSSVNNQTVTGGQSTTTLTTDVDVDLTPYVIPNSRIKLNPQSLYGLARSLDPDSYNVVSSTYTPGVGTQLNLGAALTANYSSASLYLGLVSNIFDKSSNGYTFYSTQPATWVSSGQNNQGVITSSVMATNTTIPAMDAFFVFSNSNGSTGTLLSDGTYAFAYGIDPSDGLLKLTFEPTNTAEDGYVNGDANNDLVPDADYIIASYTNSNEIDLDGNNLTIDLPGNDISGLTGEIILYDSDLTATGRSLVEQYLSAKWNIALTPWGTGDTEVEQATAADGYTVFSNMYLARLAQTSDLVLTANEQLNINLMGDTLNIPTQGSNITFNANNINVAFSTIQTNGGNITFNGALNFSNNSSINSNGGDITFNLTAPLTYNSVNHSINAMGDANNGVIAFNNDDLTAASNSINYISMQAGSFEFNTNMDFSSSYYTDIMLTSQSSLTFNNINNKNNIFATTIGDSADIIIPNGVQLNGSYVLLTPTGNIINNN